MLWRPSGPSATTLAQCVAQVVHLKMNLEKSYGGEASVVIPTGMAMEFSGLRCVSSSHVAPTIFPVAF